MPALTEPIVRTASLVMHVGVRAWVRVPDVRKVGGVELRPEVDHGSPRKMAAATIPRTAPRSTMPRRVFSIRVGPSAAGTRASPRSRLHAVPGLTPPGGRGLPFSGRGRRVRPAPAGRAPHTPARGTPYFPPSPGRGLARGP